MKRQPSAKAAYERLQQRLQRSLEHCVRLTESTPTPGLLGTPDPNLLKDVLGASEDSQFWQNFKKAAPILFCLAVDDDK